jgi:predicted ATP-binding protein involved in virulence
MRIRRIQLYRFRGFDDLQLIFPPKENLTVFIGQNGSGKTSLLDGIGMILQDSLYKHHKYDKVEWNNPLNVQNPHLYGSISLGLQGPRRSYEFSQSLSASRTRFISEDKLVLEKNRDLTDEEKMEHYKAQGEMAFKDKFFDKALDEYLKLASLQEKVFGIDNVDLAETYKTIGLSYFYINNFEKSNEYYEKYLFIMTKILDYNSAYLLIVFSLIGLNNVQLNKPRLAIRYLEKSLQMQEIDLIYNSDYIAQILFNCGKSYFELGQNVKAVENYKKALLIFENIPNTNSMQIKINNSMSVAYKKLHELAKSTYCKEKAQALSIDEKEIDITIPELYLNNDADSLKHFNEYLEARMPLVLYYSSHHTDIEVYKDALPMAFRIPMTTDFDMISDWFIEYENEENRKRLRVDTEYRSVELETIREVITKGLSLLNNESENHFTELQTEIDETVKDGQVASWLSIKKDGKRLNVKQLSDGEKRVLILLIDITRRLITVGKTNKETDFFNGFGIVLIDEIEQHLHPKWQRMLLPTLHKLFPNLQFIVTTHSPQVLSYVPNGCAYSLVDGKAFPENTYGRNNEWILEAIMDDVSRPVKVKAKLDEYFDAIRDNEMDKATQLREGLETLIGADEPELLKADILIRRKQKSVAKNEDNS